MKVLLLNDYGTVEGGAEQMTLTLRDGLRQRGHETRVFASNAGQEEGFAEDECSGTLSGARTLLQVANPSAYRQLRRVLDTFQPDVVHVKVFLTQLSPLILPLLRTVPVLYHAVWYRAVCPLGTKTLPDGTSCQSPWGTACYQNGCLPLRDWPLLMLQMKCWERWRDVFDLVVANSEATKGRLQGEGINVDEVVWNGVPAPAAEAPLDSSPTVVFAGRLVPEKGVDILLQAFSQVVRQVPSARLLVAGEGPEKDRLRQRVRELGIAENVSIPGHIPHEKMERRFASAWVQVVPSVWEEPFGLVAAEALMRGTAVVASRAGGLENIVRDGETGLLVPPGDPEALASSLVRLLQNQTLAKRLGENGREMARTHLSKETFVTRFLELYERLLNEQ